ncbi:hypothetical protein TSTA_008210, partial [Talaromyces stipitatus ATCC 10500]
MASVHEAIESLQSSNDVVIIWVPCIAHVIQLSLKDLLGKMKAAPKIDTAEQTWSDDRVDSLHSKPCDLYQRESSAPRVILQLANQGAKACANPGCCYSVELHVLNACTRKETPVDLRYFLLPVRPRALCLELGAVVPFHRFTTLLSKSKDVIIYWVFKVYNKLFDHLEKSIRQLRQKR